MNKSLFAVLASLLMALSIHGAELGDAAKPLDIKDWVKGSPVDIAAGKGKTIYVVEFWATWCAPCLKSIPHLTDLQKQFKDKDVVFIGVSNEKTDVVKKFVEKMGSQMDYAVAVDAGKTSEGYMEAYGATGIPHAFVVDKQGKVIWEGHPMDGLDKALEQIVAGKYDVTSAKKRALVAAKLNRYVELTLSGENPDKLAKLETELVELEKELGNIVNGQKFDPADIKKRIQFGEKAMKYQQLLATGASDAEVAAVEKDLEANVPAGVDLQEFKDGVKKAMAQRKESIEIQKLFTAYAASVAEDGNAEKAVELGKQLAELKTSNPEILGGIAWTILTDDRIKNRDKKLALGLAKRAVDATESKNANILDTYARALFETGDKDGAIAQEKKAIELAEDEDAKTEMKAALSRYEGKAPATK